MQPRNSFAAIAVLAALAMSAAHAQLSPLPPTPSVQLAVDPITNKVYAANREANTITALDATTGTSATIAVGGGPEFIAVDPTRNRVFVNNARDASLTVVNGGSNTVLATHPIGSMGPIAINPDPTVPRNVVYIVRMTSAASDEVTYFYPNNDAPTWYSIATDSFQPGALAVNPATHTIFVPHYATGDVRIIEGEFNGNDFPHPPSRGMWSKPFAVAANPVTNTAYVITEDARGPIAVINGATLDVVFPAILAGHATGPRSIAVNPVTNRIYAAFANEVIAIDGATNALTYIPIAGASSGAISLGINYATNRIYAATALGTLSIIDGGSNTVESSQPIAAGTTSIGINPVTNKVYLYAGTITTLAGVPGSPQSIPLTTTITPLAGNTSGPSGSLALGASSGFAPTALPVRKVYYRIDSTTGPWTEAAATGSGTYSATFSSLTSGSHTVYAFAVDDQVAPLSTGPQSIPLVGQIASYSFTVSGSVATPFVSLASSSNPSRQGDSVTFTASVTGSAGTATGTVTFLDGANAICSGVTLTAGSAGCTTGTLSTGDHTIRAQYSGDTHYGSATSASITQTVNAARVAASLTLGSSPNPSLVAQSVTFTLAASGGSGTPTGTATFREGATVLCNAVALVSGSAACSISTLAAGSHTVTADYSGDASYNASSASVTQAVNKRDADLLLTSSANPSIAGDTVTFSLAATGSAGAPTGTVTFNDGATVLCSAVALAGGNASCSTSTLGAGAHSITAQYSGDTRYNTRGAALSQTVNAAKSNAALSPSASPNPSSVGQNVTFTLLITGDNGAPTGTVTFVEAETVVCSATVSLGRATCGSAALAGGMHTITARYSGDTRYNAGTSAPITQTVSSPKAAPSVRVASSRNPSTQGEAVTFTATVSGSAGVPTGSVGFLDAGSAIAGCANVAVATGSASCTTASLATGTHTITAQYSGDAAYLAASDSLSQAVQAAPPPPPADADVAISQSSNAGTTTAGDDVVFTLTVSNAGPATATNVTVSDTIPSGTTLVSASAICGGTSTLTCAVGTLTPGSTMQLVVRVRTMAAGTIVNNASVAASQPDPAGGNNASALSVSVNAVPQPPPAPPPPASLSNISTRGVAGTGNDVLIGGFVIGGQGTKTVAVIAAGPSLRAAGIANSLANPTLTLVRASDGQTIATNDNWGDAANARQLQAAGFAPAHALEAAIMVTLPPGAYTAIVNSADGTTGVGLVAVYEVDHPEVPLVNLATRGKVMTGNDVMIGGLVIQGDAPQTVVIAGTGPSLTQFGVADALANPVLTLVRMSDQSTVASNDNWVDAPNAAQIQAAGFAPSDSREAAIMVTLEPGAYTAILSGAGGGTGVGVVAVYRP
jgi:uncharacterized repeat protein (TIGR01451 family)